MVEFNGSCGKKISINPAYVEYVYESNLMGKSCTLICLHSGKKIFVCDSYDYVVKTIERSNIFKHEREYHHDYR